MQRTIAEVVIECRLIGITDRHSRHSGKDIASFNFPQTPQVGASWRQLPIIEHGQYIIVVPGIAYSNNGNL